MGSGQFSDFLMDDVSEKDEPIKPLWTVKKDDETGKWVKHAFTASMKRNARFNEEVRENLKMYKGEVFDKQKTSANSRLTSESGIDPLMEKARNAKLYDNRIYDLVEWRVTTHNADKPGIDISPANTDYKDRVGAKIAKAVKDTVWYLQDEDEQERITLRHTFLCGEHYMGVLWDPDSGDLHPDYQKLLDKEQEKEDKKQSKKDKDSGDEETANDKYNASIEVSGKKYDKNNPIHIGDAVFKHFPAWKVMPEQVDEWRKVSYLITWDVEYVDEVKEQYPKFKDLIETTELSGDIEGFDMEYLRRLKNEGKTIIITVYGKRTCYQPNGRYIKSTMNGDILEDRGTPYSHNNLPLIRLTDMDIPGELRGKSFLRNIKGLQYQQFFLTSMIAANVRLMGYPKWWTEQGAINPSDLLNARNIIVGKPGSQPPKIIQPNPTPPEVFKQRDDLNGFMDQKVKGQFSSAQDIPPRIDSALALQYLDEKDLKRLHTMFAKVNKFRVNHTVMLLSVTGQFYSVDDKRLLRIVGDNNAYDIKYFDYEDFDRPYDVRVSPGSALPEQKSARIEAIQEIAKIPGINLSGQRIADLLDLGDADKAYDIVTKSTKAAESVVQDLMVGNKVPEPEGYEDLIAYWNVFSVSIQDRQFKESVPKTIKAKVLDYLNCIEGLMLEKSLKNPMFQQQVMALTNYPLVFNLPNGSLGAPNSAIGPAQQVVNAAPPPPPAPPQQPKPIPHGTDVHMASALAANSVTPQDLQALSATPATPQPKA